MQTAFTDLAVNSLPEGYPWDTHTRGLGLRVGKRRRTWVVLIAPGNRPAIGVYPTTSLPDAHKEARRRLAEKTLGLSGHTPRTVFEDARSDFLADCAGRLRPGTVRLYRHHLTRHFPFGRQLLSEITPRQIIKALADIPPSQKEHA